MKVNPRERVFIDSSDPLCPNQIIHGNESYSFKPPFPPLIDPKDLIAKRSDGEKAPTRAPNAFIIYRRACVETARARGYYLPMTVISTMASKLWEQEPPHVISLYKSIARDANKHHSEIFPQSIRRKKRKKWNIVSFQKPTQMIGSSILANLSQSPPTKNSKETYDNLPQTSKFNATKENFPECYELEKRSTYPSSNLSFESCCEIIDSSVNYNLPYSSPEVIFDGYPERLSSDTATLPIVGDSGVIISNVLGSFSIYGVDYTNLRISTSNLNVTPISDDISGVTLLSDIRN
ncbi:599_t:CDS:1 [Acaulospora morrowiae]|uniref:599_t:CDS:1 n=1 Tax=Acaulospora morrowiae TaxID=94023 RepID=A0A9N8YUZ4_9GLOM|nr:599_t:CDS:1 [Acaulospora morrowiae]